MKTLINTVQYLLDNVLDADQSTEKMDNLLKYPGEDNLPIEVYKKVLFNEISQFIEDRFRAVRQDFTILGERNSLAEFKCNLIIARFIVLCLNQCLCYDSFTGLQALLKLFKDQLNKSLSALRESIEITFSFSNEKKENNINNYNSNCVITQEEIEEVVFYSVVLNLDEPIDVISILNRFKDLCHNSILGEKSKFKLALKVVKMYNSKNYIEYFKLIRSNRCEYLDACILSLHFNFMRINGLDQLSTPSNKTQISISKLQEMFLFDSNEECLDFLDWYGIENSDVENSDQPISLRVVNERSNATHLKSYVNEKFIESKRVLLDNNSNNNNNNYNNKKAGVVKLSRKSICLKNINLEELKKIVFNNFQLNKNTKASQKFIRNEDSILKAKNSIENNNISNKNSNLFDCETLNDKNTNKLPNIYNKPSNQDNSFINTNNNLLDNNDISNVSNLENKQSKSNKIFNSSSTDTNNLNSLFYKTSSKLDYLKEDDILIESADFNNKSNTSDLKSANNKFINSISDSKNNNINTDNPNSLFNIKSSSNKLEESIKTNNNFFDKNDHANTSTLKDNILTANNTATINNNSSLNSFAKENDNKLNNPIFFSNLNNNTLKNDKIKNIDKKEEIINKSNNDAINTNSNSINNKITSKPDPNKILIDKVEPLIKNYFITKFKQRLVNSILLKKYYEQRLQKFFSQKQKLERLKLFLRLKDIYNDKQYSKEAFEISFQSLCNYNSDNVNNTYFSETEKLFMNKINLPKLANDGILTSFPELIDNLTVNYIENTGSKVNYYSEFDEIKPSNLNKMEEEVQDTDKDNDNNFNSKNLMLKNNFIPVYLKIRICMITQKPLLIKSQLFNKLFRDNDQKNKQLTVTENEYSIKVKYCNMVSIKKSKKSNNNNSFVFSDYTNLNNSNEENFKDIQNIRFNIEVDFDTYFFDTIKIFHSLEKFAQEEYLNLISYNKYLLFLDFSNTNLIEDVFNFQNTLNINTKEHLLIYYNEEYPYLRSALSRESYLGCSLKEGIKRIINNDFSNDKENEYSGYGLKHQLFILKELTRTINFVDFFSIIEIDNEKNLTHNNYEHTSYLNTNKLQFSSMETLRYNYICNLTAQNNQLLKRILLKNTNEKGLHDSNMEVVQFDTKPLFIFSRIEYFNQKRINDAFNTLGEHFELTHNFKFNGFKTMSRFIEEIKKGNNNHTLSNISNCKNNFKGIEGKGKTIHYIKQELDKIKNQYWLDFFSQLRQCIVGISFIKEVLSVTYQLNTYYLEYLLKTGIKNEIEIDFYYFHHEILRDFTNKISAIQINALFKRLFKSETFVFEEFIKAPNLEKFFTILLTILEKEFHLNLEKYEKYFDIKYQYNQESENNVEIDNKKSYLAIKKLIIDKIKSVITINKLEFINMFKTNKSLSITFIVISYFNTCVKFVNLGLQSKKDTDKFEYDFFEPEWIKKISHNDNYYSNTNYIVNDISLNKNSLFASGFDVFTDVHETDNYSKNELISKILVDSDKTFMNLLRIFVCPEITIYMKMNYVKISSLDENFFKSSNDNKQSSINNSINNFLVIKGLKDTYMKYYLDDKNNNTKDKIEFNSKSIEKSSNLLNNNESTEFINESFLGKKRTIKEYDNTLDKSVIFQRAVHSNLSEQTNQLFYNGISNYLNMKNLNKNNSLSEIKVRRIPHDKSFFENLLKEQTFFS